MSDYKAVYDKLTAELARRTSADKRVQSVLKKIESGKAALSDTFALAANKGRLLGAVFRENLADLDPQTTERVYDMLMRDMQREITDKMAAVQRAADEKHGISLGAPQPTYPAERIAKIAASLHDPTVPPETLARRAQSATETVTMAFHDDYVRDNAEFRSDAGFPCFIDRIADGGCCKWCAAMAGHYEFGEEPPDMWCRHDNCRCEIVYANGYKVQSLRGTKKSWDIKTDHSYEEYRAKQPDKKTAESAEKYEPETLTREQAAQAEAEGLAKYANTLDFSAGSGIIEAGSSDEALEYQRYGRNKSTLVNKTYIESGEYRRKYDKISDEPAVNKALYNTAKESLKHRSGTLYEDMYWIDSVSGKVVASEVDSTIEQKIVYSEVTKKAVASYPKNSLIAIHSHPSSMPPSIADFNSCFRNGYKNGVIACHNGKVFVYTSEQEVSEDLYSLYVSSYISDGNSEYDAQLKALDKLRENHMIDFAEVT